MKNRLPTSTKEIPKAIKKEFDTLIWYQRALEELDQMESSRASRLSKSIKMMMVTPLLLQEPNHLSDHPTQREPGDPILESLEDPKWADRLFFSEETANWICNVRNWKAYLFMGLSVLVILFLAWRFVHPN